MNRKLDSLNLEYAQTQNIVALHNQKEDMLLTLAMFIWIVINEDWKPILGG